MVLILFGFYARLSTKLFISMALYTVFTWLVLNALHHSTLSVLMVSLVIWVIAWAGQFYGHHVEGAKPSFTQDSVFLLVGPAFVLEKLMKRFGSSLVTA